jgi:flagellar hook-basal body complex protein FliE
MITSIESIAAISRNDALKEETATSSTSQAGMFGSIFQSAIQNVKDTDAELVQSEYLLSTGQIDNPATVTIAATKNELAVDLLVQLRNKALDAYSQLTQITL